MRVLAKELNGIVLLKIIIEHPSESGTRKDEQGNVIPAHFIREGRVTLNGAPLFDLELGPSVSRDPFFQLKFAGKKGDQIKLEFTDSKFQEFTAECAVT
ncbi:MAG: thiosulfate oxidation carrier complex protein SoxZ [Chlorobiaceae bacterium]|jgi:sulfur-oxidizing protein SoxZ|nr:thiosulfate oxidation carrier complex protein SoxZ [Chlorobiaceae bacterium]